MKKLKTSTWIALSVLLLVMALTAVVAIWRQGSSDAHAEPSRDSSASVAPPRSGLAAADANGDGIVYQDGMHPWIVEDAPGTCPICGMELMPVHVDEATDGSIRVSPATIQNIGVRTAPVRIESLPYTVRTTGRFEANESRVAAVSPKISGWIETLHVNYEGARISKGQPLLEIYSPELVSSQEEFLLALRNRMRLNGTPAAGDADRLVDAARRRLSYWDITEEQLRRLEETGEPRKTLSLYAPASGTVVSTQAVEGQRVAAGETLMQIADLSTLWLMVDVYEQDLHWVMVGTEALVELPYQPGSAVSGRVDYVYDELDADTRSLRARITVPNPGLRLKPGMYATVTLRGNTSEPMPVVPAEAVVRTGLRDVIILAMGEGRFLPAEVVIGSQANGLVQIARGLEGHETVVTSAQFLIDSEARLQSAVSSMISGEGDSSAMSGGPSDPASNPHAGH